MGRKLLETHIGPQNTWPKSYMASMTRQRTPWRTHDTYVAIKSVTEKNPIWKLSVTENFVTDYRA